MRKLSTVIVEKSGTWARLLICILFVIGGANYSHGEKNHHQSGQQRVDHHAGGDNIVPIPALHDHFENTAKPVQLNDFGVHCGSPELQPSEVLIYRSVVFAETIKPILVPVMANYLLGIEPPPPRT